MFLGLIWQAWFTILLVLGMFSLLIWSRLPTDTVFLGGMALLVLSGCLSPADALSGFSSQTVVVVGALFYVIAGLDATGVLHWIVQHLMGTPRTYRQAILRLMLPVAALSAFLTNTTVVALFVRIVKLWARKLRIAPSRLLIPLSYASGMGGICTLIGTPPNLIISGFYADETGHQMGIFEPLLPGLICLVTGVLTVILLQRLLPSREAPKEEKGLSEETPKQGMKTVLASLIMVGMVFLSAFKILPLLHSCFLAALLMLGTRCCNSSQIKEAMNWDVLMVFACSVTLGKAIEQTGLAQLLADHICLWCGGSAFWALVVMCLAGTFLTEFISNTACGALLAPIALKLSTTLGADPTAFCVALMISCSSSFATPIGSPTHLLVYIPGGYRFTDFLRIGLPMNFIILAANILAVCLLYPKVLG